jgi:hypothetical protein
MTDPARAAREDLAFMKAIADDKGPLPTLIGAHMLAAGAPYGLNFVLIWAIFAGHAPWWPQSLMMATWLPGTVVYAPLCLFLTLRGSGNTPGPTARLFIAAWSAVGLIVLPTVAVMVIAQLKTGVAYAMLWPALSFVFWGGAWASLAVIRRKAWHGIVAAGSLATALASAVMIKDTAAWLVMAAGMLLFVGLPGAAILSRARWAD